MTTRLFTSALFAGLVAGLIAVLLQWSIMEKLILEGEEYETGNKNHFAGVLVINEAGEAAGDVVEVEEEEPENLLMRYSLAFFAAFVVFVGWSLMMTAGFAIAERFGKRITIKDGLLWGIAGYAAVHMLPSIGLPPELPGTPAANLELRQLWWVSTAVASVLGIALIAYGQSAVYVVIGLALLVAPHLIGAPHMEGYSGLAPPELSGEYVARSLAVGMIAWVALGLAAGYFWNRSAPAHTA